MTCDILGNNTVLDDDVSFIDNLYTNSSGTSFYYIPVKDNLITKILI